MSYSFQNAKTWFRKSFSWLMNELDDEAQQLLLMSLEPMYLDAGEALCRFGEYHDALIFAPLGKLDVSKSASRKAKAPTIMLQPGTGVLVGDLGAVRPGKASATVKVGKSMPLFRLRYDKLRWLVDSDHPEIAGQIYLRLGKQIALRLARASAVRFERNENEEGELMFPSAMAIRDGIEDAYRNVRIRIPRSHSGDTLSSIEAKNTSETLLKRMLEEKELWPLGYKRGDVPHDVEERGATDTPEDMGKQSIGFLSRAAELLSYQNASIVSQGDPSDAVFYIIEGECGLSVEGDKDADFEIQKPMGPGRLFGQVGFFLNDERTATVRGSCRVAVFHVALINMVMSAGITGTRVGSHFLRWMAAEIADDARELNRRIWEAFQQHERG